MGVTRVARVTGLDRAGVEVACAVRPRGHVLQVSNGKGLTFAEAARGALLEAAELHASEAVPPGAGPLLLVAAQDLLGGEPTLVPARAVYCPPPGARPLAGPEARWTSNGMGAHPSRAAALLHALLEAAERDQVARALPRFWTRAAVERRLLHRASLARSAPVAARLAARIEARGFEVFLFDLVPGPGSGSGSGPRPRPASISSDRWSLGLPVAGALLFDTHLGPQPVTAGYACALSRDRALTAALLEAAQSRLTDIHGAREDVAPMDPEAAALLHAFCREARGARPASRLPHHPVRGARADLGRVLRLLRAAGIAQVPWVDLSPPGLGVCVVRVLVPGLRLTELL
ncbi:MAG: YcaO-like family protein [Deltaproteobacteria bacterium]|nr:YcaO-like family protein [Deltaproteobacteria bacterium]